MTNLSLRLPDSLHAKVRELAERDAVSINQFIATAVAEKAAALLTVEYLEERARQSDPGALERILSRVPDVAPISGDEPSEKGLPKRARRSASNRKPSRAKRPPRTAHR
jgi:hypothetical protein